MLAQVLISISLAAHALAAPASGFELAARQGYDEHCTSFYTVAAGDTCVGIQTKLNNIFTLDRFFMLNPQVNSACTNLFPGEVVCIASEGYPKPSS
ncbi:putative carbohydrate-binding module family 50 protein [Rosellinia necatrix]|uniref:Putative carbohydrate-binding module family 50 protein n=1 Tax=Rosellinia necatrix TaxID=77044 RepID=A0A1S7UI18_ROSNE|nr:putative carbohydrate-binding module family 50 protein [Rosellinia necatrix]